MLKRNKKVIAAVIASALTATAIASVTRPVTRAYGDYSYMTGISFATEDELEEARNERDAALAQAQAAAGRVSELRQQRDSLTGELTRLQEEQEEMQGQYQLLASQYAYALLAKAEALDRFVQAQDTLEETQQRFQERLSVMFEYQNKSYLEILLESDSIAGFFTNIEIIALIADSDEQAVREMQTALDDAEAQAQFALEEADRMEQAANDKMEEITALEAQIGLTNDSIASLTGSITEAEAAQGRFNAIADELSGQIETMQSEIEAQYNLQPDINSDTAFDDVIVEPGHEDSLPEIPEDGTDETEPTEPSGDSGETDETETTPAPTATPTPVPTTAPATSSTGQLQWPTWCRSIGSYYGWREHPIYHDLRFHQGIDIEDGFGDVIAASASGTVVYVEQPVPDSNYGGSGYGNYLIIDHGNGLYTLYAHCRSIYVSSGESVSCGQAIGEVGSTGGSTGAHLHFEVRTGGAWGSTVDPLAYLA